MNSFAEKTWQLPQMADRLLSVLPSYTRYPNRPIQTAGISYAMFDLRDAQVQEQVQKMLRATGRFRGGPMRQETGRYVRSAIFYTSEGQRLTALDTIADVDASGLWPGKVVTEVTEAGPFWEAEQDDQDYLQNSPLAIRARSSASI
jgi:peptide methionine sulfoxide reductase MsrA